MLEVRGLDAFYGDLQILYDVSLSIREGEIVGLIGPNAVGKTTLFKAICGLVKSVEGSVLFMGRNIENMPTHEIVRSGLSLVPQGRQVFPYMTVLENLRLGSYCPEARERREESMEWIFGIFPILQERKHQLASLLSGGEQQMLSIARGLMSRPKMLLLDEPSGGLAPGFVDEVRRVMDVVNTSGITIFLIEQRIRWLLTVAQRVYIMRNGRISDECESEDLLKDDQYIRRI